MVGRVGRFLGEVPGRREALIREQVFFFQKKWQGKLLHTGHVLKHLCQIMRTKIRKRKDFPRESAGVWWKDLGRGEVGVLRSRRRSFRFFRFFELPP